MQCFGVDNPQVWCLSEGLVLWETMPESPLASSTQEALQGMGSGSDSHKGYT